MFGDSDCGCKGMMQPLDWFVGQVLAKQMKDLELDFTEQCNSLRAMVSYQLGKRVITVQDSYIFKVGVIYRRKCMRS